MSTDWVGYDVFAWFFRCFEVMSYFGNAPLIRRRWYCYAPGGKLLCVAKEDSIILSLLRRLLGNLLGLLRTNFIILKPNSNQVIGEFNRKYTLFDQYILDMSGDKARAFDRRIMLALAILLDTGEQR